MHQRVTPVQAVEDWLRRMGESSVSESAGGLPSGTQRTRPPYPPVLSSTEIVKRRAVTGRQVDAVSYRDTSGDRWFWIIRLIEDDGGSWRVCGGGGGNGDDPQSDAPWINLAGSWGKYGLAVGGRVGGGGAERAALARLRIGDTLLEDDVGRGVVLFVTSEPATGSTAIVELLTQDGDVLWSNELQLDD